MFSNVLRQKLVSPATQILSINDLTKELSPAYILNISIIRVYIQELITIL